MFKRAWLRQLKPYHNLNASYGPGIFCIQSRLEGEECSVTTWQVHNCVLAKQNHFVVIQKLSMLVIWYVTRITYVDLQNSAVVQHRHQQIRSCVVDHGSSVQIHTGKNSTRIQKMVEDSIHMLALWQPQVGGWDTFRRGLWRVNGQGNTGQLCWWPQWLRNR